MTRHELEELLRTVFSGCTGIKRINVRTKWKAEPDNIPKKAETWLSFAIMSRESPKAQVLHLETLDGEGSSRVMTHETIEVLTSFFGPDAEDMAVRLKAALQVSQNREALFREGVAFVRGGNVTTMPALVAFGWRPRADMTLTFRRAPKKSFGTVEIPAESTPEGTVNIRHAKEAETGFRVNR